MFLRLGAGGGALWRPWYTGAAMVHRVFTINERFVFCLGVVCVVCCSGNYFHVAKTVRRQNLYSISPRRSGLGTEPSRPTLIARRE
jgi:hypothetical protein